MRSSKKRCLSPPDKTLIVRFVAGFFSNLNSAIWFGLNLKQQLSEEERGHKTHIAKQDTSPPFDEMLDLAPEHLHATAVLGGTQNGGPTFIVKPGMSSR